jgi:hypothetical protein
LKDDLPPITTFLNRLLALTIDMQAVLFSAFEELLDQRIEGAIAAGVYDLGLETLRAESFRVTDARVIYTHPGSGAETQLLTIAEKRRNTPTALADALDWLDDPKARLLVNSRSGRAAVPRHGYPGEPRRQSQEARHFCHEVREGGVSPLTSILCLRKHVF